MYIVFLFLCESVCINKHITWTVVTCRVNFFSVCYFLMYYLHAFLCVLSRCLCAFLKSLKTLINLRELNLADNNIEKIGRSGPFLLILILIWFCTM